MILPPVTTWFAGGEENSWGMWSSGWTAQALGHDRDHRRPAEGLFAGRFGTDRDGYKAMLAAGGKFSDRIWAVEGVTGSAAMSRSALRHSE
jgi:hypothetical protein